jgi:perosamine synthetase
VITLRNATMDDADLLLEWANDPDVRRASVNSDPIDRETHVAWLSAKLDDAETAFYICERDGARIGYARAERRDDDSAELAVSVAREQRNGGVGRRLIALASARAQAELGVTRVLARVKQDNASSLRAFESSGFIVDSEDGDLKHLELAAAAIVPHSRPFVGAEEAAAAATVVASRNLAAGRVVAELETEWNVATGTAEAAAVGSGVAALRLALLALGVGAGDEVIVPAYSCVALLNAPLSLGATPVLADVELDAWTLSVEHVARKVSPKTRAIIAVNLFGMPAPLAELAELGLPVVEDCAHGIGGRTSGGPFGAGSEVSMSSFYATKMLGAGEGGIVAAKDPELVERARTARDYGDQLPDGRHLNDKLTDIQAAVALVQLRKLEGILREREARAAAYTEALAPLAEGGLVTLPENRPGRIWYRYAVRLHDHFAGHVSARMATCGVRAEQPVWDLRACEQWTEDLEDTAQAFDRVVSLPLYPDLTTREQDLVCDAFADAVRKT